MEIRTNKIVVEKFSFETILENLEQTENQIQTQIHEAEPTGEDKSILEEGKVFKIDLPFELVLPQFRVNGRISQVVQLVGYFGKIEEMDNSVIATISESLLSYIKRLTYEVTEIAFDRPGVELDFSKN